MARLGRKTHPELEASRQERARRNELRLRLALHAVPMISFEWDIARDRASFRSVYFRPFAEHRHVQPICGRPGRSRGDRRIFPKSYASVMTPSASSPSYQILQSLTPRAAPQKRRSERGACDSFPLPSPPVSCFPVRGRQRAATPCHQRKQRAYLKTRGQTKVRHLRRNGFTLRAEAAL
jgi:hypothetical protein